MKRQIILAAAVGLALAVVTAACGGSDPTPTRPPAAVPTLDARIAGLKAASEAKGLRFLTHDEIVAGAMREGKLVVAPGFDDRSFPAMKASFNEAYPFLELDIQLVSGTAAGERLNFAMLAGESDIDLVEASVDDWALYAANDLLLPYDYEAMALAGELAISPQAISHTPAGQLPFFATSLSGIVYNTDLVSEEDAPTTWADCHAPRFRGKVATSTTTGMGGLSGQIGKLTADEILDFARAMKANDVIFTQGITATLVRLLAGEFHVFCPATYHSSLRQLIADPDAPMKIVLADPLPVSPREAEGIYAGAKHPHAALLWMEWVSTAEVQLELLAKTDPGKASFLVEGTLPYNTIRDFAGQVLLCVDQCQLDKAAIETRIITEAWGFPRIGSGS